MSPQGGDPTPVDEAALPPDRCPNCHGPVRRSAGQAEAYCSSCRIFIEILAPSTGAPVRDPGDGNEVRRRTARLYIDLDDLLDEDSEAAPPGPTKAESALHADEAPALEASSARDSGGPRAVAELPSPGAHPPQGSSAFSDDLIDDLGLEPQSAAPSASGVVRPRTWHRVLFYLGSGLVAVGGSGFLLGSLLHDVFRVPLVGFAYDAFGNLNMTAAGLGAAILLAGIVAMAAGARAGSRPRRTSEA